MSSSAFYETLSVNSSTSFAGAFEVREEEFRSETNLFPEPDFSFQKTLFNQGKTNMNGHKEEEINSNCKIYFCT